MPALAELRDQGVVGAIGAGMNQSAMLARFLRETDVDVVMLAGRYTLLDQSAAGRRPARRAANTARASSPSASSTPGCCPATGPPTA